MATRTYTQTLPSIVSIVERAPTVEETQRLLERREGERYFLPQPMGDPDSSPEDGNGGPGSSPTEDIPCLVESIVADVKVVNAHEVTSYSKKTGEPLKFIWVKVSKDPRKIIAEGPFSQKTKDTLYSELGYGKGRKTPYIVLHSKHKPRKGTQLFLVKCEGNPEYEFVEWLRKSSIQKSSAGKIALREYAVMTGKKLGVKVPRKGTLARDIITRRVLRAREIIRKIVNNCHGYPLTPECREWIQVVCQGTLIDQFNRNDLNEVAKKFGIVDPSHKTKGEICHSLLMGKHTGYRLGGHRKRIKTPPRRRSSRMRKTPSRKSPKRRISRKSPKRRSKSPNAFVKWVREKPQLLAGGAWF